VNINKLIAKKNREVLKIAEDVDIHIQYITCNGDNQNRLTFYNDLYKLDRKALKDLFPQLFAL
jgi:murein L,D-transpeptidase YcbB/YkuD